MIPFVQLPTGDTVSSGPIAGTLGAVKRSSTARHGVVEAGLGAAPVGPPRNAARPRTEKTVPQREKFWFHVFHILFSTS